MKEIPKRKIPELEVLGKNSLVTRDTPPTRENDFLVSGDKTLHSAPLTAIKKEKENPS